MESILSELGVVNGDETDMMLKVQTLVEENQAAKSGVNLVTAGTEGVDNLEEGEVSLVNSAQRNKRSVLESIMDGANAALDIPTRITNGPAQQRKQPYKKIEKVKFISALEDIPNDHEKEMRYSGAKRGYYDASTSLNLFSGANSGGVQHYRNSTNVDNDVLLDIVRDAKRGKDTSSSSNYSQSVSSPVEEAVPSDGEDSEDFESIRQTAISAELNNHSHRRSDPQSSSSRDVICPICNRNLGSGSSAAQSSVLLDRHVERCARRGSRNVVNYAHAGEEEDGEEETSSSRTRRKSGRATAQAASSNSRGASNSRGGSADSHSDSRAQVEEKEENGEVWNDDEEQEGDQLDLSVFDDDQESLNGSVYGGARGSQRRNSLRTSRTSDVPSRTSSRSTRNTRSVRQSAESENDAEFDAENPVAHAARAKPRQTAESCGKIKRSTKTGSTDSNTPASTVCEDEEEAFVASIVDDWEDSAYDQRLALVAEAFERNKSRNKKRRKVNKTGTASSPTSSSEVGVADASGPGASDVAGVPEEDDSEYIRTEYGTEMLRSTWQKLHQYQRDGCRWLHGLYEEGVGGILGDEMGLGKTAQVCTHFGSLGLLHNENAAATHAARPVSSLFIVVCPATVLHHWLQEFHHWAPFMRAVVLHAVSATASELLKLGNLSIPRVLRKLQRKHNTRGLVVITTYEGLRKHRQDLVSMEWTAVCLDEGQKIRNPATEITSTCKMLPAFHRLILSGTPIQNSLRELWSLFDFIYPGRLGSLVVFEQEFATPIRMGGYANANALQYEIAIRCASTLQRIVKPYLLRRKKDDLITVTNLPPKTEQVLFCQISPRQREIYLNIIESSEVKAVMERRMMAFRAINTLRKLCNHPALVFQQGKIVWQQDPLLEATRTGPGGSKNSSAGLEEGDDEQDDDDGDAVGLLNKVGSGGLVWADSGKLLVLSKLLPLWYTEGHKVLIFSQTRGMLSVIESMVRELGFLYLRMDGSTPVGKRAGLVNRFNTEKNIFVMLLTTRTGGVGISLTAANRVVLFDPDWNPMTDMQSRERAWRLGQKREVTVYRLITRGTIEEKIYQRQIFKLLLSNRILENAKQKALFSQSHMKELFELNDSFCKAGQDRHGYQVAGEALPTGGEVNLRSAEPAAAITGDTSRATDNEPRNGAQGGLQRISDENFMQIEDYVEAPPLSAELEAQMESSEAPAPDGSNSRDRRLLQALFAGDAITSVYDHHYFDPTGQGGDSASASANLKAGAARVARRAEANNVVDRALSELQASATGYRLASAPLSAPSASSAVMNSTGGVRSNTSSTTNLAALNISTERGGQEVDLHHPYVAPPPLASLNAGGDSASVGASGASRPRFGAASSTMTGPSSASLLAGLSNALHPPTQPVAMRFGNVSSSALSGGNASMQATGGARVVQLPQTVAADPSAGASSGGAGKLTVRQDIQNRLAALFGRADRPLTTAFVLSRFKDLGDQYAPLFRELLRAVAVHNNGTWTKK